MVAEPVNGPPLNAVAGIESFPLILSPDDVSVMVKGAITLPDDPTEVRLIDPLNVPLPMPPVSVAGPDTVAPVRLKAPVAFVTVNVVLTVAASAPQIST